MSANNPINPADVARLAGEKTYIGVLRKQAATLRVRNKELAAKLKYRDEEVSKLMSNLRQALADNAELKIILSKTEGSK